MSLTETPICDFGVPARAFELRGVDGDIWDLERCRGEKATLVMFICNHCPYVKAVLDRIVRVAQDLEDKGVKCVAIMSNDPTDYPEDSFENMYAVASRFGFPFPYLIDGSQDVAREYGAVCTPDFFGYNADLELQYRGRIDSSEKEPAPKDLPRELFEAMIQIVDTGKGPDDQIPSMGCSIKWRDPEDSFL